MLVMKKEILVFVGIVLLFFALRLPAIHSPYHQDEYKWPIIVNPALTEPGGIPHPPLSEVIYRATFYLFGSDNFRLTPLLFGFANLVLIYLIVRRRYSVNAAVWAVLFFALSYYSVLASLMVDTDGQILPFFFLLALWFYDSFNFSLSGKKKLWLTLFLLSLIAGILVKMSFILAMGTFVLDFLIEKQIFKNKGRLMKSLSLGFVGIVILAALIYFSKFVFPFFNLEFAVKYWEGFARGFSDRNFLQTGIQFVKAIFYLSPALVLSGLISLWPYKKELKVLHIFLGLGLIFYLFVFDFSQGALDRYFQFMIVPLCIIAGFLFEEVFKDKFSKKIVLIAVIVSCLIFLLQYVSQYAPPLYPKTEWISRFISLKWNFLFPFTGGSGPLPFYVSFLFISVAYLYTAILTIFSYIKKNLRSEFILAIFILGLVYNLAFTQEYLFGNINGSASTLVARAAKFIEEDPDIKMVTVYNDNGGYEVIKTGKYRKRLYIDPKFDVTEKVKTLNTYKEHYLVVEIPNIDSDTVYAEYFNSCQTIFKEEDKYITARIYDCRNIPDLEIK